MDFTPYRSQRFRMVQDTPRRAALFCAVTMLSLAATAEVSAQNIQLARQRGPYYVGEPVVVQIVASGFEPGAQPTCSLQGEPPSGVTLQGPQLSQSSQSFTQIINGQISSSESVDYRFSFVVTADREGEYAIGPFEVVYQGVTKQVEGVTFQFGKLTNDPDMQIALSVPQDSVYVGQEVPVTIRWSFAGEMAAVQYAFSNLQIRSPLFDQFTFKEQPRQSRTALTIATAKGGMEVDAEVTQEEQGGRRCVVVSGSLTLVPDTPGKFASIPVSCRTKKVTQWGRDLFGDPTARANAPARVAGTPLSFEVKAIPLEGRPASFSGAVGGAFSIDVSANRSVVRVGDPISLTLSVRGDGNLASVSLPAFTDSAGMSADLFQIPSEQVAGTFDGNAKQFKVNVRVKDQRVTQIPPIDFSWFDPSQARFQTARSKPIALQVMESQVVSAADVVSAAPATGSTATSGTQPASQSENRANTSAGFAFVGANLAIEQDVTRLLTNTALGTSPKTIAIVVYALAAAVLVGGVVLRRRAQMDTESHRKKKRLKSLRKQVTSAAHLPPREGSDRIAKTLRELVAHYDVGRRADADDAIAQCENIIYSTGQDDGHRLHALMQQALALVDDTAGEP
jgi:hypothetical protein